MVWNDASKGSKRFELVFPYRAVFQLEFGPKFKSGVQDGGVGGGVRAAAVRVPRRGSDRGAGPISLQGGAKDMVDGAGIYDPSAVLHPLIRWNRTGACAGLAHTSECGPSLARPLTRVVCRPMTLTMRCIRRWAPRTAASV